MPGSLRNEALPCPSGHWQEAGVGRPEVCRPWKLGGPEAAQRLLLHWRKPGPQPRQKPTRAQREGDGQ